MTAIRKRTVIFAALFALGFMTQVSAATTQMTKVKVGRTVGGSGFHIPSYVALDKGFFKGEGLDAEFIATTAGVLVRAAIAREIEFVPIPGGGSEAMLKGAPLSFPHAARAEKEGMKVLLRTGDYIPRLGGTFLTHKDFIKEKRDVVKRFVRAMVKAEDYVKANKKGTIEVIQKYFDINDPKVSESIYNQVYDKYRPEMPPEMIRDLFESRTTPELGWPQGKPLPDLEQFVDRSLLNEVFKEMGRKPAK